MVASFQFYEQRSSHFQKEVAELDRSIRNYSLGRIIVALAVVLLGYFGFSNNLFFYSLPLLIFLFIALVRKQLALEEERKVILLLVKLNQFESAAQQNDFSNFADGRDFLDPQHPYSYDLDLFGKGSVFQYLNRCATRLGETRLATELTQPSFSKTAIEERQHAILELAPRIEFRQRCWAIGKRIHDAEFNLEMLYSWLSERPLFLGRKMIEVMRWVLPAITCAMLIGIFFDPVFRLAFFFMMIVQLSIAAFYSRPIDVLQTKLSTYRIILENYSQLFFQTSHQSWNSSVMQNHGQRASEAAANVKQFSKLVDALESRMNMIARMFGNGIFLYDFHSVVRLEKWRVSHASALPSWIQSLSEWDALLSLSTLHYNNPDFTFPKINDSLSITGKNVGHALIPAAERVTNDVELGKPTNVMLITGANMAGKSTFLRTIGVNFILASIGSPVCASYWSSPLVQLRTGMRTSDSLQEHQSYFYAELNRLHSIIEDLRANKPLLILLDEILKGTNSTDKQSGSRELIKQLIKQPALVLLATHDIALGDLQAQFPDQIVNTCFEGKIDNEQLSFDYKLNKGLAQRANATFLMRKMGIIPPSN